MVIRAFKPDKNTSKHHEFHESENVIETTLLGRRDRGGVSIRIRSGGTVAEMDELRQSEIESEYMEDVAICEEYHTKTTSIPNILAIFNITKKTLYSILDEYNVPRRKLTRRK